MNSRPRAILSASALALCLAFPPLQALDYLNSSPAGSAFPEWDGGDTELCFADIDGDGNVDFATIGDHGSPYINTDQHGVMVYFGDGTGGWSIHMEGNFGYGGIAVGDANGDGLMDVGYGMHHNYSGGDLGDQLIEVALGDGSGAAWTPWDDGLATHGEDWGMFATDFADFDLDGDLDLASNSFGCCNGVHVYINDGDGHWTQSWASGGGNAQGFLCTGDVNGDGAPDIAASHQVGAVWLGDGAGGFSSGDAGLPAIESSGLKGVSLGDADGDGRADLAFAKNGGLFVYAWRLDHWESISDGLPSSGSYDATQLWDMDLDGDMDLAGLANGACTIWLGDDAGHWTTGGGFSITGVSDCQAFTAGGDVDHNGHPDLALLVEQGSWPSYQNHLYVYRESSTPHARSIHWQFPRGGEAFVLGSAITLRWSAAQLGAAPASVGIELSTSGLEGPWTVLAAGLPDGGHWQWRVDGEATADARLRITLSQEYESVSAVTGALRLLPSVYTATPDAGMEASPRLRVLSNPAVGRVRFAMESPAGLPPGTSLAIYDIGGRRLRSLALDGGHPVWDLRDARGARQSAGVYLARLEGQRTATPALRFVLLAGP